MENHLSALSIKDKGKDNHFRTQMKRVFAALYQRPKTMLEVAQETGILRANICRYIAYWEKLGVVKIVKNGICSISRYPAGFYTSNPQNFPIDNQLGFFNDLSYD